MAYPSGIITRNELPFAGPGMVQRTLLAVDAPAGSATLTLIDGSFLPTSEGYVQIGGAVPERLQFAVRAGNVLTLVGVTSSDHFLGEPVACGPSGEYYNTGTTEIIAIEVELGITPSGTFTTVRDRLDYLEANIGGGGSDTFIGLTDTPADYVGADNFLLRVSPTSAEVVFEAGVDWSELLNVPAMVSAFTDLSDTPPALGTPGQIVVVDNAGTALEFQTFSPSSGSGFIYDYVAPGTGVPVAGDFEFDNADPLLATTLFINELDANGNFVGSYLSIIGADDWVFFAGATVASGLVFQASGDAVLTAGVYAVPIAPATMIDEGTTVGEQYRVSAQSSAAPQLFTDLIDTPPDYIGQAGLFAQVNPGETGLIFAAAGGGTGLVGWETVGAEPDVDFQPTVGNTTGQLLALDGTVPLPGIAFAGKNDVGIYRLAPDGLGFISGGREALRLGPNEMGEAGTVLTSNGVGTAATWQAAGGSGLTGWETSGAEPDAIFQPTAGNTNGRIVVTEGGGIDDALRFKFGAAPIGFYTIASNRLMIQTNTGKLWKWFDDGLTINDPTTGAMLSTQTPSATVPGFNFQGDTDTGIGHAAADEISLIAGSIEALRLGSNVMGAPGTVLTSNGPSTVATWQAAGGGSGLVGWETVGAEPDALFQPTAGNIGDAAIILGVGTASLPSLRFLGSIDGFYYPVAGAVGIAIDGLEVARYGALGLSAESTTIRWAGTLALPNYSFTGDPDTGVATPGPDEVSMVAGAIEALRLGANPMGAAGTVLTSNGPGAVATWAEAGGGGTPLVGWETTGAEPNAIFQPTAGNTAGRIIVPVAGSSAAPSIAFGDGNTGFYEVSDNNVEFSQGGTRRIEFDGGVKTRAAGASWSGALISVVPSATVPTVVPNWQDLDTGMGHAAVDELSIIAGGVESLRLGATPIGALGTVLTSAGPALPATWETPIVGATLFTELEDTPPVLGSPGQVVVVAGSGAALDFQTFTPQSAGYNYIFDDAIVSPPAVGAFQFNNADPTLATECYINETDFQGNWIGVYLALVELDDWIILVGATSASGVVFAANGPGVDNGTWWTIPIKPASVNNQGIVAAEQYRISVQRPASPVPSDGSPVGSMTAFGGVTAPAGWLLCDGQAIDRVVYANLFAVINIAYGAGDTTTTFNVPDLRQRFPLGKADAGTGSVLGEVGGIIDHTHLVTGVPLHTHTATDSGHVHAVTDPGHIHVATDAGHTHAITDPTHTHAIVDPTHTHVATDSGHTHVVTDPTHGHGASQAGHTHVVTDPTHSHNTGEKQIFQSGNDRWGYVTAASGGNQQTDSVYASATGISLDTQTPAVTVDAAATGITIASGLAVVTNAASATGISVTGIGTGITINTGVALVSIASSPTGVTVDSGVALITVADAGVASPPTDTNNPPYQTVNWIIKV